MDAPRIPDDFELIEWIYNYRRRVQYIEREYLDLRIRLRVLYNPIRRDLESYSTHGTFMIYVIEMN
jgi:hypothetical protein